MSAAQEQGGEGARVLPSLGDDPRPLLSGTPEGFGTESLSQEEALSLLEQRTEGRMSHFLDDQSDYLERANQSEVENSVVNFSLGASKASESSALYRDAMDAIHNPVPEGGGGASANILGSPTEQSAQNYATAFDVDLELLRSDDLSARASETAKLQQGIIDHVSSTFDNSEMIGDSAERWDNAVESFEARNNSVVIAASNEGEVVDLFNLDNGGQSPEVPVDFETNILENDLVTSVGATEANGNCRTAYSSNSPGVDIYANGTVGEGEHAVQGTSFAAPRVAMTMAELHRLHPNRSSAEIEQMLTQNLTEEGCEANSGAPVLRPEIDLEFLRHQTF